MSVTYNKLWHLLLDRGMKKKDLKEAADDIAQSNKVEGVALYLKKLLGGTE